MSLEYTTTICTLTTEAPISVNGTTNTIFTGKRNRKKIV